MGFSKLEILKEKIRDLVDAESVLLSLGFSIFSKNGKELRAPCLIHGGDNPTAFRMRKDTKRFSCYSHKCEYTNGMVDNDIFSLVMKVKGVGFLEAVNFLAESVGIDPSSCSFNSEAVAGILYKKDIENHISQTKRVESNSKPLPELLEETVNTFIQNRCGYFDRLGIDKSIQNYFELGGGWVDAWGIVRATIPIRDESGRVVSISGRRVDCNEDPRYLLFKDFIKSRVLYNFNNALKFKKVFGDTIVLVEGFKACWAVHSSGFPNVAACMGATLLEPQVRLLAENGFMKCILMFDGDLPGKKGEELAFSLSKKYIRTIKTDLYGSFTGMCPDDIPQDILMNMIFSLMEK